MSKRGQALVELALVLPIFVVLLLFVSYFGELVVAKLQLREAARFLAWEMTALPLDDLGAADPDSSTAFAQAAALGQRRAQARFSVPRAESDGALSRWSSFSAQVDNQAVPLDEAPLTGEGGRSLRAVFEEVALNRQGWVRAVVSQEGTTRLLPEKVLALRDQLSLIASDWHLPDGTDAVMSSGRAGRHRGRTSGEHPLYGQTRRMRALGPTSLPEPTLAWQPNPSGVYVVSHNYQPSTQPGACSNLEGYPDGARNGLNDLARSPGLDAPLPRCFDTAPFRDTQVYDRSLYLQMFLQRGPYFLGSHCAEADEPGDPSACQRGAP